MHLSQHIIEKEKKQVRQPNSYVRGFFVAKRVSHFEHEKGGVETMPLRKEPQPTEYSAKPQSACYSTAPERIGGTTIKAIGLPALTEAEVLEKHHYESNDLRRPKNKKDEVTESGLTALLGLNELILKRNKMEIKSIERTEEKRRKVAKEAELRRLELFIACSKRKPTKSDNDLITSSQWFIEPSVFDNQGATAIANMHEDVKVLATAQQLINSDVNQERVSNQTAESLKVLQETSYWCRYEKEKIANLERFDKKDKKAATLLKKVIDHSEGEFEDKTLLCIHRELAPQQSHLMLQPELQTD